MIGTMLVALVSGVIAASSAAKLPPEPAATTTRPVKSAKRASPITIVLKDNERLRGVPQSIDDRAIVMLTGGKTVAVELERVRPISVYLVRRRFVDLSQAATHLALGEYLLTHGLSQLAEREFATALKMDASLREAVEAARKAAPDAAAGAAETKPASQPGHATAALPEQPDAPLKYRPVTPEQARQNRRKATAWAEQARKAFVPTMHLVETEHFLIFSAWDRSNDRRLRDICEKMYDAMCVQFDIPAERNIWAGKCPIYIFWEVAHYERFCREVDKAGQRSERLIKANGYYWQQGHFTYIVMNRCRTKRRFYEVLVHEATHAFLGRHISNRRVPRWANEGLAEYMSGTLVPGSTASTNYIRQSRIAVKENRDVSHIFQDVGLNAFDYGIAASIVRFMIASNRKGFVEFIRLLKLGKAEADALKEGFGMTHQELLKAWRAAVKKAQASRG
jgi:hypothetical protein